MAITKNTDYLGEGIGRLLQQYKDKPRFASLLKAWLTEVQAVEDAMWDVFTERLVSVASDNLLDILGEIVGQKRNGQTDDHYRYLVMARIRTNRSGGTHDDLVTIASLLVEQSIPISVTDLYPAAVIIFPQGVFPTDPFVAATQFLAKAVSAGVRMIFIWTTTNYDSTLLFGDDGSGLFNPGPGQLLGSVYDGSIGGLLSSVIQG